MPSDLYASIFVPCCNFFNPPALPTFGPRGVSLDVSDEMATTRRQCKHLLNRLFAMVCMYVCVYVCIVCVCMYVCIMYVYVCT